MLIADMHDLMFETSEHTARQHWQRQGQGIVCVDTKIELEIFLRACSLGWCIGL